MYGVGAVLDSEDIDLVIHLDKDANLEDYDRLGSMDNTCEILGESRPQINVPVLPGRNLAVIVEVATRNFQLKQQGHDALEELRKRTNLNLPDFATKIATVWTKKTCLLLKNTRVKAKPLSVSTKSFIQISR